MRCLWYNTSCQVSSKNPDIRCRHLQLRWVWTLVNLLLPKCFVRQIRRRFSVSDSARYCTRHIVGLMEEYHGARHHRHRTSVYRIYSASSYEETQINLQSCDNDAQGACRVSLLLKCRPMGYSPAAGQIPAIIILFNHQPRTDRQTVKKLNKNQICGCMAAWRLDYTITITQSRNSIKLWHMLGSESNLKMQIQNLGHPLSVKIGA